MYCSPHSKRTFGTHETCFSKNQLISISKKLQLKISPQKNKALIWNAINEKMASICSPKDETCWIRKLNIDASKSHVPKSPPSWKTNPYEWLTSSDIFNVMIQYEHRYRSFKFIGVFPIDFGSKTISGSCISNELCEIQFNRIKNKNQFGIVFNLDKHYQSGSHWVCVYINLKKTSKNYGFFFFDSAGSPMPQEIRVLSETVKEQANDDNFKIYQNTIQKQFKNTECGMFCLYFLIEALKKKHIKDIYNNSVRDEEVHKLRRVLFRK